LFKKIGKIVRYILFAYAAAGLVYSLAGYLYRGIVGKQNVFSPWLGIPLDIVGWPWMVYADGKHIGMGIQDAAALISLVLCIVFFIRKEWNLGKNMDGNDRLSGQ
jgi:ABC-type Na+ efflux pump permease subunit